MAVRHSQLQVTRRVAAFVSKCVLDNTETVDDFLTNVDGEGYYPFYSYIALRYCNDVDFTPPVMRVFDAIVEHTDVLLSAIMALQHTEPIAPVVSSTELAEDPQ